MPYQPFSGYIGRLFGAEVAFAYVYAETPC